MVKSSVVLVGGSGFIGTRLASRLLAREQTELVIADIVPSRGFPDRYIHADVTDVKSLAKAIPDGATVVNLAAEHRDDVSPPSRYWDVNVEGARNLCEVASSKFVTKLVFTSTVAVYGFGPVGTCEDGLTKPFNEYGRSKLAAEAIYHDWQAQRPDERSLTILRPTVVFGERNRGNVYNLLKNVVSNRFVMVGKGANRKSIAYVENVAAAIEHCMQFGAGKFVYNYVDKPDFSMNELVAEVRRLVGKRPTVNIRLPYWAGYSLGRLLDLVAKLSGRTFPVSAIRVKKFCTDTVFDTSIGRTGFQPPISIAMALQRTIVSEFLEGRGEEDVFYAE